MPENFVYGADFTDARGCPVKPGMTRKEREDDEGRSPTESGMTMEGARVVPLFKTPAKRAVLAQRVAQFVLLEAFAQILGEGAF